MAGLPLASQCATTMPPSSIGAISVVRAGLAFCPKSDGTVVSVGANLPRIGRFGILSENAVTQRLTAPRDLTNAAWVKTTMTAALTATGADGAANSASTITATAGAATVLQTFTGGSVQRTFSASIKRRTGTGTVSVTVDNATYCDVTAALATAMANGCTWLRLSEYGNDWHDTARVCQAGCGALTLTGVTQVVGFKLATNADAIDVDLTQLEDAAYASTPMNGASRAADIITVTPNATWPVGAGSVEVVATPMWALNGFSAPDLRTAFDSRAGAGAGDGQWTYMSDGTSVLTYGVRNNATPSQSTHTLNPAASLWVGDLQFHTPRAFRVDWDSTLIRARFNGVNRNTVVAATNLPAAVPTSVHLGSLYDVTLDWHGYIGSITVRKDTLKSVTAVATVGDSIMRGAWDVYVSAALQSAVGRTRQVTPYAVSGDTTVGCTTQYTTSVQGKDFNWIVNNCGINNLLGGGQTDVVAWGNMQTLLNQQVADGFNVVAVNLTPCGGYAPCNGTVDGYRTSVNASLAAWVVANSARARLVDADLLLRNTGNPAQLAARCLDETSDFLHPDNSCSIEYAQAIAAAIP